jgi:hypothetical protein
MPENEPLFILVQTATRVLEDGTRNDKAIFCFSACSLHLVDIVVFNSCNANAYGFGKRYTNDAGLDGKTFFTGSQDFQVKEIEVFKIRD